MLERGPTIRQSGLERERCRAEAPEAVARGLAEGGTGGAVPRAGEGRYRALFDNLPLMVFKLDAEGRVLEVNEHGARELGYDSGELLGRSVLRVFHPEDRPAAERQLAWALDFPRDVARWELRKVRKDGSVLWVRETVRIVRSPDAKPEILVVCEDVSERRRAVSRLAEARDQLRELNAELSRVEEDEAGRIARVLHDELGQTLAAARMTVCELRAAEASGARASRLEDLRALVEQSIEVTRSLTFQLSPPILHDLGLAAALQALCEQTAADHGFRFGFALGEGWSPPAEDVGTVLYRVVRELLHNVTKHSDAGRVRLELDGTDSRIRIGLEDDGVGFDAAACDDGAGGRSLGLFHVRERMERLGGRFEIDSELGEGTRASLKLPVAAPVERRRRDRRRSP